MALVLCAPIALIILLVVRSRASADDDVATLRLVRAGAAAYVALALALTLAAVVGHLTRDTIEVALPTQPYWPALPDGVEIIPTEGARVTGGGFTEAMVSVSGVGWAPRVLLAVGALVQGLTQLAVAAAVLVLAHRLLAGDPFRPVVSRAVMVAAVALVAGGVLWQVCFGIGESWAARDALGGVGLGWDATRVAEDPSALLPQPRVRVNIDFWPVFTGLALAAVATAFRAGERLQRDTAGLV